MQGDLLAAVREMRLEEFLSERFMEQVLKKSPILEKQKAKFRKYRKEFEEIVDPDGMRTRLRVSSSVGELIDILESAQPWQLGLGQSHAGFVLQEYIELTLRKAAFSAEAQKVLDLI